MGLHDNPSDEAALALTELAARSGKDLSIKFYVLPGTLDEAQRVLLSQLQLIERVRATPSMARAALTQPLPSIAKKFFSIAASSNGLNPSDYFAPYIDGLRMILQQKGIAVLEVSPALRMHQDVVDDVLAEQDRERNEVPENRRKSYEALLHDVVLWHAVQARRNSTTESPFEIEYWAVSIDWRLIGFDRAKRAGERSRMPIVLHPSGLVQLIQFWVPRTAELEKTLVEALRLPLLFQSFDHEDEKATIRVLEVLSRYENVEDIPEGTLGVILANQALRARLQEANQTADEAIQLVREELLKEHRQTTSALEAVKEDLKEKERKLQLHEEQAEVTKTELERITRTKEELENAARRLEQSAAQDVAALSEQKASLEARASSAERRFERQRFVLLFIVLPLLLGILIIQFASRPLIELISIPTTDFQKSIISGGLFLLPFATAFAFAAEYVRQRSHISNWMPAKVVAWIGRKLFIAPLVSASQAVYQGGVWDWVKNLLKFD